MHNSPLYIGIDCGTSGVRALAIDGSKTTIAQATFLMTSFGKNHRDPFVWHATFVAALKSLLQKIDANRVQSICIDGTSGTLLPIDGNGDPLASGAMYNDACQKATILKSIDDHAPTASAAHGATSGLAKALAFQQLFPDANLVHQADWLAGKLCGDFSSDPNNALKTGFDPFDEVWPDWIADTGLNIRSLPQILETGTPKAEILPAVANEFSLPKHVQIIAGTTDSCASFVATGAQDIGEGVTVLGTTLAVKQLSDQPIFSPEFGVYSHRLLGKWLVGGASNSGGNVLLSHFSVEEIEQFTTSINPETDTGLDYYPLSSPSERFPISDPDFLPQMTPVSSNRIEFLKAIFEGIAKIEAQSFAKLTQLGSPQLTSVRSIGGGAKNHTWTRIRQRKLNVKMLPSRSNQAAFGTALLAKLGAR